MARMLDMIRNSQVPSNLMQSAARGSLSVSPGETIEILVHLVLHHKLFSEQARLTLAGWDEKASIAAAGDPQTSVEVLGYFVSPKNLRPRLLSALVENPSLSEEVLDQLALSGSRSVADVFLASARVAASPRLLEALHGNASLRPNEVAEVAKKLAAQQPPSDTGAGTAEVEAAADDPVVETAVAKYLEENAAELAAEKDKPFQPLGGGNDETVGGLAVGPAAPIAGAEVAKTDAATAADAGSATVRKAPVAPVADRRDSVLQKISKLGIQGRIALAMRGSKEERGILIRDSTKLVSVAVLDSPKVSDGEVERFALQKNVLEAVLRAIPMRRKYAKNYCIMRNLVFNPRTPMDLSLSLMKNLLVHDLKNLSGNKEVSDTVRKLALRMFKQKVEKKD